MSISSNVFNKHGAASFDLVSSQGCGTCAIFKYQDPSDGDQSEKIGCILTSKEVWKAFERQKDKRPLFNSSETLSVNDLNIRKKGLFAWSTVDFHLSDGSVFTGKTDKGFSEFLLGMKSLIRNA